MAPDNGQPKPGCSILLLLQQLQAITLRAVTRTESSPLLPLPLHLLLTITQPPGATGWDHAAFIHLFIQNMR